MKRPCLGSTHLPSYSQRSCLSRRVIACQFWQACRCSAAATVQDPTVPNALSRKMMQRIVNVDYSFPPSCQPSPEARDLLSRIFVQDPVQVRAAVLWPARRRRGRSRLRLQLRAGRQDWPACSNPDPQNSPRA